MAQEIFQVDSFSSVPFKGNPAGVCILPEPAAAEWMQNVAREMNLSETAFLVPGNGRYGLRWFTPAVEVDLCGHATLASAHILWETGVRDRNENLRFDTRSGELTASWEPPLIRLNFPTLPPEPVSPPADLLESLDAKAEYIGRNRDDYMVLVGSEADVRALRPDFTRLKSLAARGVIVTSAADDPKIDFVSRFFAPGSGVDEDPVTGSAHTCLGPFWAERLKKDELVGYQASARGGFVYVRMIGDRTEIGGEAVTVLRADLFD